MCHTSKAYSSSTFILILPKKIGKTAAEMLVIGQQFLNLCMRNGLQDTAVCCMVFNGFYVHVFIPEGTGVLEIVHIIEFT